MPRILLVGLGRWGREHLRVLRSLGAEVFAADLRPECREEALSVLPPDHVGEDFRPFLEGVDGVDVVTPVQEHFWICREALDAGKDVLVEKPITATLKEARDLRERVGATRARLQVGHVFRFHPVYEALRTTLASGRLGQLRYLAARFAGLKRPRPDGGVTHSDAIHFLDLFIDLLGRPRAVTAILRDFLGRGMDDFSLAVVEYDRELAVVESGYFVPGTWRVLQAIGDRGACVADFARWRWPFIRDITARFAAGGRSNRRPKRSRRLSGTNRSGASYGRFSRESRRASLPRWTPRRGIRPFSWSKRPAPRQHWAVVFSWRRWSDDPPLPPPC